MTVIIQLKRDTNPAIRAILITGAVPAGAMRQNGVAYHPGGSLYVIRRPA